MIVHRSPTFRVIQTLGKTKVTRANVGPNNCSDTSSPIRLHSKLLRRMIFYQKSLGV